MAPIGAIYYGCEPLTGGNDGTFWTDALANVRLRLEDGGLHGGPRQGATSLQCQIGDDITAIYIAPGGDRCQTFRDLTQLTAALGRLCPGGTAPATGSRALLTVIMPPLQAGVHEGVEVRLAATIDAETGGINKSSGTPYLVLYRGRVEVEARAGETHLSYDLHRDTDLPMFPLKLRGEQYIPTDPRGAQITRLPFTVSGQGTGLRLELIKPLDVFVQSQLQRLKMGNAWFPRLGGVRTLEDLAASLAVDPTRQAISDAVTRRITRHK